MHEAARVVNAMRDIAFEIRQFCQTVAECPVARRRTARPFVLDEVVKRVDSPTCGLANGAMDVINLKISNVGGLTKVRLIRDICIDCGIPVTIEETLGGDILAARIAHPAQATLEEFSFLAAYFNSTGTVDLADGAPRRVDGALRGAHLWGLGVNPIWAVLGMPVLSV